MITKLFSKFNLLLFIFIFTMLFTFEFFSINFRYFVLVFWLIFIVITKGFKFPKKAFFFIIFPLIIIIYSLIVLLINQSFNFFEVLRMSRVFSTSFLIILFLYNHKFSSDYIFSNLLIVLFFHSLVVSISIIFPSVKDLILPISQYRIEFFSLRSSGFLSGFDDSGLILNFGLVMSLLFSLMMRKNPINLLTVLFSLSIFFSSRVNIVLLIIIFFFLIFYLISNKQLQYIFSILFILFVFSFSGILFLLLTTNLSLELRSLLLTMIPSLRNFYEFSLSSYTDYGVFSSTISRHFQIINISSFQILFGQGVVKVDSDVGYIKTIYSIGILGIFFQFLYYFFLILFVTNKQTIKHFSLLLTRSFLFSLLLMFIMEFKISVVFSTTTFELLFFMIATLFLDK
jgi:hypothetical protein